MELIKLGRGSFGTIKKVRRRSDGKVHPAKLNRVLDTV